MKEGDRLIISENNSGHVFVIGEEVQLIEKDETGLFDWYAKSSLTHISFFIVESDVKPITEQT